jgi:heparan-alpha-glucosaminide N-acetyltransferase
MKTLPARIGSIDVFRALTMLLMVFVNALPILVSFPKWLAHAPVQEDAMGLSDVVFPLFLFIVGLSIPFAIHSRLKKGQSIFVITKHLLVRAFALIVMGFYMVNMEKYNSDAAPISLGLWVVLMLVAFFLVWNDYPAKDGLAKKLFLALQSVGVLILIFLAIVYRGGPTDKPTGMHVYWWGILGLIGWAYLISAFVYLGAKSNLWILGAALVFFNVCNVGYYAGWLRFLDPVRHYVWIMGNGAMPALTMGGVFASAIYMKLASQEKIKTFLWILVILGCAMLVFGFAMRPAWGISKDRATPAWVGICTGIGYLVFAFLYVVVDLRQKGAWFKVIRPAATSTLTCYLIPYWVQVGMAIAGIELPLSMRTGGVGIFVCVLFAFLVVAITGALERIHIKLKL